MEKVKYFLVLEKRLGDYNIVDINKLDICNSVVTNDIASIDCFTCMYTEEEIKASVARGNITHSDYLNGTLKIVSDMKHNLKVLTKDKFLAIREFQTSDLELNRELKNKLFGLYKKVIETTFEDKSFIQGMLDRFKICLKGNDKKEMFSILEELPYQKSRMIYLNLYEEINKREKEILKILEKLNDAA